MNAIYSHEIIVERSDDGERYAALVEEWLKDIDADYEKTENDRAVKFSWSESLIMRFEGEK